jgi:hypothetical protein
MKKLSKITRLRAPTVTPQATIRRFGGDALDDADNLYILVKASTGEEHSRHILDDREVPAKADWLAIYQKFAERLAYDVDVLSPTEHRALWLVVAKAGFGNKTVLNVSATARDWGIARQTLSRALSGLVGRRIIERAKGGAYRLNPNFCWKGDHELLSHHRAAWAKEGAKRGVA